MPGALDGVVVADFSRVLAGPYATMLLADLGATVVKVERPGTGDDTRGWGPPFAADGQSTYFQSVNRGKRSIALDLGDPRDLDIAHQIVGAADVLIENYRAGSLERFGLDYASVHAAHPALVYCTITGFGSSAGAELPGYDLLVQAVGGLMSITGTTEPTKVGVALVDVLTGLQATVGILAALRHRDASGEGQHLEVTLLGSLQSALVNQVSGVLGAGVNPTFMGNAHPSIAPYEVFTAQDRPLVLAVGNDQQFRRLVEVLGEPRMADDARFTANAARVEHRSELVALLNSLLIERPADHWQEVLTAAGVPCGPINDIAQGLALADRLGLEPIVDIVTSDGTAMHRQVANPVRFSLTPVEYASTPPRLDADRQAVLDLVAQRSARGRS